MIKKDIIYMSAGEESGDLLGSEVIRHIQSLRPDALIKGIGGKKMISAGLIPVFRTEKLGFMGFFELLKHTFVIRKAFKAVLKGILEDRPGTILMIDFSEFHIKLAKKIKKYLPDTRIIKYVSPQIWASREKRIKDITEYYDCICCILPFETEIYKDHAIDCRYVGHPLMDKFDIQTGYEQFYKKFNLSESKTLISVFPGSRKQEIKKHMSVIAGFIRKLTTENSDVEIVICKSGNLPDNIFSGYKLPSSARIISSEYQWEVMSYSGIVLCKSGTSTLQTAITGTPSVVFYKVNPLSFLIARMIVKTKFISLPNIIAGKQINPELIQSAFTVENLIAETRRLLDHEDIYKMRKTELGLVKDMIGEKGAAEKVARAVLDYSIS